MGKKPLPAAGARQLLCMWESNINKENIRIQLEISLQLPTYKTILMYTNLIWNTQYGDKNTIF